MTDTTTTTDVAIAQAVAIAVAAPMHWRTTKGTAKAAHSPIAQALAPRAVRLSAAQQETLRQLENGQYRPFLRDVLNTIGKADLKALIKLGFIGTDADGRPVGPTDKRGMIALVKAIARLWADTKGQKALLAATMSVWINTMESN